MNIGPITFLVAREQDRNRRREAARDRLPDVGSTPVTRVTLRYASAGDARALRRLAELEAVASPSAGALVAEVDGRLRAALPLDGSVPIADRLHGGEELLELLRVRAAQLVA
jgi:hypothetical protein